jgi:hypothetical protein
LDPANNSTENPDRPDYLVVLRCPACGERASQRVMKSNLLLTTHVPGHPFLRAYTWSDSKAREVRPIHLGVCLCPHCNYPGTDADFRQGHERTHGISRSLRRLFVEQDAGANLPLAEILGEGVEQKKEPERSLRLHLAAIAAQRLLYPELWRRREIGQLYLRLTWLYVDQLHLRWDQFRPTSVPSYHDEGPGYDEMMEALRRIEPMRDVWPDAPLNEQLAREEALRFYQDAYTTRADSPSPEELVAEERLLGVLFGMNGDPVKAKEMYERAVENCARLRQAAYREHQSAWENGLTASEAKALATRVQRLNLMAEEIREEMKVVFAPPKPAPTPVTPIRPAAAPAPVKKKRFGIFG